MEPHGYTYPYHAATLQAGTKKLVPCGISRILDLGGGRGGNGAAIKAMTGASFVCCADISEAVLNDAAKRVDATVVCDIEAPKSLETVFEKHGTFDLVLCLDVLEHLVDPWRQVARLHALMPVGAYILASIPNVQNYRMIIRILTGTFRYRSSGLFDRTHLRFFSRGSAVEMMTSTGLALREVGKTYGPARFDPIVDTFSLGLLSRFVTMQHQILVQKVSDSVADPGFCGSLIPNLTTSNDQKPVS